jgi:hypothetical protein
VLEFSIIPVLSVFRGFIFPYFSDFYFLHSLLHFSNIFCKLYLSPTFKTLKKPRIRFQGSDSVSLCSLAESYPSEPNFWAPQKFKNSGSVLEFYNDPWGAKNRVGMGLSHRPGRLHMLAKSIPWNRFLGSLKSLKISSQAAYSGRIDSWVPYKFRNTVSENTYKQCSLKNKDKCSPTSLVLLNRIQDVSR